MAVKLDSILLAKQRDADRMQKPDISEAIFRCAGKGLAIGGPKFGRFPILSR